MTGNEHHDDDTQGDLLALIAADRSRTDGAQVRAAILADARAHGGRIDPNRVRRALTNASGHTLAQVQEMFDDDPPSRYALGKHRSVHLSDELWEVLQEARADAVRARAAAKWTPELRAQVEREAAALDRRLAAAQARLDAR